MKYRARARAGSTPCYTIRLNTEFGRTGNITVYLSNQVHDFIYEPLEFHVQLNATDENPNPVSITYPFLKEAVQDLYNQLMMQAQYKAKFGSKTSRAGASVFLDSYPTFNDFLTVYRRVEAAMSKARNDRRKHTFYIDMVI